MNKDKVDVDQIFKQVLFSTFKEVISFLDANNLRWWAAFGTILGAVRHKGIIPWDDDIDIYMPREDYNKLLAIRSKLRDTSLDVMSYYDKGYVYSFGKFVNKNTTLWEQEQVPFVSGVYIDIFPLDLTAETELQIADNQKVYARRLRRMQSSYQHFDTRSYLYHIKKYGVQWIFDNIYSRINAKAVLDKFVVYDNSLNRSEGNKYVRYALSSYAIYPIEWFEGDVVLPFEDFLVKVPKGYKDLLAYCYGDYMTPPPIDSRISNHSHYYLNLKENLSLEEVKDRIKQGEHLVY